MIDSELAEQERAENPHRAQRQWRLIRRTAVESIAAVLLFYTQEEWKV
jgi:hypothetical protein